MGLGARDPDVAENIRSARFNVRLAGYSQPGSRFHVVQGLTVQNRSLLEDT